MKKIIAVFLASFIFTTPIIAQKSSSSKPSSSSKSSGSKYSSSSKPSSSSSSKSSSKYSSSGSSSFSKPNSKPSSSSGSKYSSSSSSNKSSNDFTKPTTNSNSSKPTIKYDSSASSSKKKEDSAIIFSKSASFKDKSGNVRNVDPAATKIVRDLNSDTLSTRTERARKTYGNNYNTYNTYHYPTYHDHYSNSFMSHLMTLSLMDQAMWWYSHRNYVDQSRYNEALAQNAALKTQIMMLEQQKVTADPNYVPPGIDKDLMYDDEYVQNVYNTQNQISFWLVIKYTLYVAIPCLIIYIIVYLVFIKDWKTS